MPLWMPVPGTNPFSSPYVAYRKAMVIPAKAGIHYLSLRPPRPLR